MPTAMFNETISKEITKLNSANHMMIVPNASYVGVKRFFSPYTGTNDLYNSLGPIVKYPIITALYSINYAIKAVWATLRAVGNLLILKPKAASTAFNDLCVGFTLSMTLAVMTPIHALTHAIEVLTRMATSWFSGQESRSDLTPFKNRLDEVINRFSTSSLLPNANNIKEAKFFEHCDDVFEFFVAMFFPFGRLINGGVLSLLYALQSVSEATNFLANIAICKPRHAKECLENLGIHFTLSLSFALMAPINALIYEIAFMTRLGATWVKAAARPEEFESQPQPALAC